MMKGLVPPKGLVSPPCTRSHSNRCICHPLAAPHHHHHPFERLASRSVIYLLRVSMRVNLSSFIYICTRSPVATIKWSTLSVQVDAPKSYCRSAGEHAHPEAPIEKTRLWAESGQSLKMLAVSEKETESIRRGVRETTTWERSAPFGQHALAPVALGALRATAGSATFSRNSRKPATAQSAWNKQIRTKI